MIFEWDKFKNRANIRMHGIDFADAEEMFRGVLVVDPDTREDWRKALGWARNDRRSHRVPCFHGAWPGYHSHHFTEKGKPA